MSKNVEVPIVHRADDALGLFGLCNTDQPMDRLVLPRSGSVGPQFMIPLP
jgi:hypothetical protein